MKTLWTTVVLFLTLAMAACSSNSKFDEDSDGGEDGGADGGDGDTDSDADSDSDTDSDADGDADGGEDSDSETDTESDYETIVEGCDPSAVAWPLQWSIKETELLGYINAAREGGADCGPEEGVFGPTAPLVMNPYLQCAARVHSLDWGTQGYTSPNDPGNLLGGTPEDRVENAGYDGLFLGENYAAGGDGDPYNTIDIWLGMSSTHTCATLMDPEATEVGIGFASVDGSPYQFYGVADFGTP